MLVGTFKREPAKLVAAPAPPRAGAGSAASAACGVRTRLSTAPEASRCAPLRVLLMDPRQGVPKPATVKVATIDCLRKVAKQRLRLKGRAQSLTFRTSAGQLVAHDGDVAQLCAQVQDSNSVLHVVTRCRKTAGKSRT